MTCPIRIMSAVLMALLTFASLNQSFAQDEKPAEPDVDYSKLKVSNLEIPDGTSKEIMELIRIAQKVQPTSEKEYLELNRIVMTAAEKIMAKEEDKTSKLHQQAQQFTLHIGLALIESLKPAEREKELKRYAAYLNGVKQWDENSFQLGMQVPSVFAQVDRELGIKAYDAVGKAFLRSGHPQLVQVAGSFKGAKARLNLVGNVLDLKGTKHDGSEFDLASLRGKVVLVDFWATWCGPCIREHANIKRNYIKYHDAGFEVVGISIDEDRSALDGFLKDHKIPWITIHEKGGEHPAMEKYGIEGVPTMFLVGKDGKVISLEARGPELTELLREQLGDVDKEKKAPESKEG